jgi:N utilization substance protein B
MSEERDEELELRRLGTRSGARRRALDVLYAADLLEQPVATVLARELNDPQRPAPDAYAVELATGVDRRRGDVDARIEAAAEHWTLERMPLIDRNLLRLGAFELLERSEVPTAVILDEAIELAKLLSTADSGRFVNGVLGRIAREVRGG